MLKILHELSEEVSAELNEEGLYVGKNFFLTVRVLFFEYN
jgi:hypothetical protein